MIVRTFTGASLRDALKDVRETFGANAVILDTKFESPAGGRLPDDARAVSVTAAYEPEPVSHTDEPAPEVAFEGPRTLHLKGDLIEETQDDFDESINPTGSAAVEWPDLEEFAEPARPLTQRGTYARPSFAYIADAQADPGNGVWGSLTRWLAIQPELIAGITDSFAAHLAESLPPLEAFLGIRLKGQNVLFVGERGAGKSTLMFKAFAARWKATQRRPGLRVISELEGHGQERLEALCAGCEADFSVHEFEKGRLDFGRGNRKGEILAEFVCGRAYTNLERQAKIIRRALKPQVVALVLNATGAPHTWKAACDRFAPFGLTHVAFTHWDECRPWWDVTAFSRQQAILLSYRVSGFEPIGEIDPFTTSELRSGLAGHVARTIGAGAAVALTGEGK